jgi:predicted permease
MTHLRIAIRQLTRVPMLCATIVLMLAFGIGATTAMFSLFYQVLVQPLPVPEPDRLVNIVHAGRGEMSGREALSYSMFRDLSERQQVFEGIAAYSPFTASLIRGGEALSVSSLAVSGAYFSVLNLRPSAGRLIGGQDEPRLDEAPVVVLSHDLWQARFGGDPGIVGSVVMVNGQSLTIIGIAPASFTGTQLGVRSQIYVPLTMRWQLDPSMPREATQNRGFNLMRLFARLRDDVSLQQASAGLNALYGNVLADVEAPLRTMSDNELQEFLQQRLELTAGARGQGSLEGAAQSLTLLLCVTVLVLLIVCVNIANLLLARGASRTGEMAVRESLGASRGRLLGQLLVESAMLAALGGILSLPVAVLTIAAITAFLPQTIANGLALEMNFAALAFAVLSTFAATLLFGLFPALRASRVDPIAATKGGARQVLGGYWATRTRAVLVTAQIAFSMVLLVLAGLFARNLGNIARIDLGIDIDSLVGFSVSPRVSGYSAEEAAGLYHRIEVALAAEPGVTAVARAAVPLISGADFESQFFIDEVDDSAVSRSARFNMVGANFFRALSIPLRAGRGFSMADMSGSRVAIVNEQFVREYGLGDNAVGRHIMVGPEERLEVVGVVADAAYSEVKGEKPPQFFIPHGALGDDNPFQAILSGSATFYVGAGIDPSVLLRAIPYVVGEVAPALPVQGLTTMQRLAHERIYIDRLVTTLSAAFAAIATLLAAIGLYGVLAYDVGQRTRELGLRLALGADPGDLRAMVFRQVGRLALLGIGVGAVAAISVGRLAESMLLGLSGYEPSALLAAAAILTAAVLGASYLPARRASGIAPMDALRDE